MRQLNMTFVEFCLLGYMTYSSETSIHFERTTRRYIPEDRTLHNGLCENLKSYISRIVDMHRGPMFLSCIAFDQEPECATKLAVHFFFKFFKWLPRACRYSRLKFLSSDPAANVIRVAITVLILHADLLSLVSSFCIFCYLGKKHLTDGPTYIDIHQFFWLPKQIHDETSVPLVGRRLPERNLKT
jgi:hypothetical protein